MPSSSTPGPDPRTHEPAGPALPQSRPPGPTGGHTVQDWEQPAARPHGAPSPATAEPDADQDLPKGGEADTPDTPSPPTVPLYLRPVAKAAEPAGTAEAAAPPPFDARKQTLTAQSAAIVDSITLGLADALAVSLRPVVAATVESLIPMILSLGSVPDDDGDDGGKLDAGDAGGGPAEAEDDESVIAPPSTDFPAAS